MCCQKGNVKMPSIRAPRALLDLHNIRRFHDNIRSYNAAFQMASSTINVTGLPQGVQQLRVNGEIQHRLGPVVPNLGQPPQFAQIYILDPQLAALQRLHIFSDLDPTIVHRLENILQEYNPHVLTYRIIPEIVRELIGRGLTLPDVILEIATNGELDLRRYNAPTVNEVAAFIPDQEYSENPHRNLQIHLTGGGVQYIPDTNALYHPLHFPLLFPGGDGGWHPFIPHVRPSRTSSNVTAREWAAFHLQQRDNASDHILRSGRLLQEFLVDSYCMTECQRLRWLRLNQNQIRADLYQDVQEAVQAGM